MNDNHDNDVTTGIDPSPHELVAVRKPANIVIQRSANRESSEPRDAEEPKADLGRILHALRRNWLLGITLGLILAGPLAAAAWVLNPLEYTAMEFIRVSPNHVPLVFETADTSPRFDFSSFKNTQRQLLIQPLALSKALKNDKVARLEFVRKLDDPIAWLQKHLEVSFPDKAEIMNISLTCEDPDAAQKIVTAVVDIYMDDFVDKERAERENRVNRLERVLTDAEDKVRKKRSELSGLVDTLGTGDSLTLNIAQQSTLQQHSLLRAELSKITFELMRAESEFSVIQNALKAAETKTADQPAKAEQNVKPDAEAQQTKQATEESDATTLTEEESRVLEDALEADPKNTKLAAEVEQLEKRMAQATKRYQPQIAQPILEKFQSQLDELRSKMHDIEERYKTKIIRSRPKRTNDPRTSDPNSAQAKVVEKAAENWPFKIGILKSQEAQLRKEMEVLKVESQNFGKSSIDVEMLRREIEDLVPVSSRVSQEIERTKIELQSSSRISRLETSGMPFGGKSTRRIPMTVAGGLLGLLAPLALLVLRDVVRNPVNNIQTIHDGMKLPVLGSIPRIPRRLVKKTNEKKTRPALVWQERVEESVNSVAALLLYKLESEGQRLIMVTSATSGEGKSTLSDHLARRIAETGRRTLVIDFDLRRPALHRRFNVPVSPGVTEVLREGMELQDAVHETSTANLFLLTAGKSQGSLLFDSKNGSIDRLLENCRNEYEMVIVDSSPLLPVVDGRLIGSLCDGAIITVVKDVSQVAQVEAACQIMNEYGITNFGCVISGNNIDKYYNTYSPVAHAAASSVKVTRSMSAM